MSSEVWMLRAVPLGRLLFEVANLPRINHACWGRLNQTHIPMSEGDGA